MLYLKPLHLSDGRDIYNMLQEISLNDNGFHNSVHGMTFTQYKIWIENEFAVDNGKLEDWMVPQSSFWLYDGDIPVGYGRIRHHLNGALEETGGHIGYAIANSRRGQGYGKQILVLLKAKSEKMGITQLQICADASNERSNKIIVYNGGVLFRESDGKNFYHMNLMQ